MSYYREMPSEVEHQWEHAGLKCVVIFVRCSHRCGYVGIPKGHPSFEKHYDDIHVSVHGGLTYSGRDIDSLKEYGGSLWWVGFDCAQLGDISLEFGSLKEIERNAHFWTLKETVAETNQLAEQLAKESEK